MLIGSKVAEFELELEMEAMQVAVAVEAELRPMVAEVELVLEPAAMLVGEPDVAAVAESMVAAVEVQAEPAEPKEVVLEVCVGVVASMVVVPVVAVPVVAVPVMAVPMAPAAASVGLEVDPRVVAFVVYLATRENAPMTAGAVFPLEADSRMAEFEESRYL